MRQWLFLQFYVNDFLKNLWNQYFLFINVFYIFWAKKKEKEKEPEKTKEMEKKIEKISENSMLNEHQLIMFLLEDLKKTTQITENYRQTLTLIKMITKNIIADPSNQNFRKIKLTNKKFLENINPFPPALDILKKAKYCDFIISCNF